MEAADSGHYQTFGLEFLPWSIGLLEILVYTVIDNICLT